MYLNAFPAFTVNVGVAATTAERVDSLDGINTTPLESWVLGAVKAGAAADRLFYLDRADSTTAPDGTTVIAPLAGPGRWKLLVIPAGAACPPLTRIAYVDNLTEVAVGEQTGSICAPYSTIQAALDNALPITATTVGLTVLNLILIAPGFYDEDLAIPQQTHISLQGLGGLPNPSLVVPGNAGIGASVYIADPTFTVSRITTIFYSELDNSGPTNQVPPSFQASHIAFDVIRVDANGALGILLALVVQGYDDCIVVEWDDVSDGEPQVRDATLDIRDSVFDTLTGQSAIVMFEHSHGFTVDIGVMAASDCIIDDLTVNQQTTLGQPFTNFSLVDTLVNSSLSTTGDAVNLSTATSWLAERLGSLAPSQVRRVQDLLGTAFQHHTVTDTNTSYTFDNAVSCVFRLNDTPGATTLPAISVVLRQPAGSVGEASQQRIVKNMSGSLADTTVTAVGGDTINNGGATLAVAPGESVILVPQSTTNWEVINL